MIFHSSIEPIYYLLPILGLIIGLFGTMIGGGGGFFFLPILTILIGVPAQTAVITSLVATLPVCFVGSYGHYRKNNIDFRIASLFAGAGIIGAFIGAAITSLISANLLKVSFGIYSIAIACNMGLNSWRDKRTTATTEEPSLKSHTKTLMGSFYGFFAGIITGTFGTSGTAPVLAGLFSLRIPVKMVIGTSMLVVLINSIFAIGAHFLVGQIDLTLVGFLTAGTTIGAFLGPKILANINTDQSEHKVKFGYAAVMLVLGILMIIA